MIPKLLVGALLIGPAASIEAMDYYFPIVVGSTRVVETKTSNSTVEFIDKIAHVERKNQKYIVTVERQIRRSSSAIRKYKYEVSTNGVFLLSQSEAQNSEPEPLLKLPTMTGSIWRHEQLDRETGITMKSTFKVGEKKTINVPAGKYKSIPVIREDTWIRNEKVISKSKSTTWYAAGIGVVRHESEEDGKKRQTELKEFTSPGDR